MILNSWSFHDCIELAEIDAPAVGSEDAWVPGQDVGRFIHKGLNPIMEQSQVILVNLVRSCMSLPVNVLRSVIAQLPDLRSAADSSTGRLAYKAAARLCSPFIVMVTVNFLCALKHIWAP